MGQRLSDALRWGRDQLRSGPTETPDLDAQVLLAHVIGATRGWVLTWPERELLLDQEEAFRSTIERRTRGEPVAYITGVKAFFGIELVVDGRVLIPRPETETLVERALKYLRGDGSGSVTIDVGTGSGAIALAVAVARPNARVFATDTSEDALVVARINAERVLAAGWESRVTFTHGELLAKLSEPADVICANLPYIPTGKLATLPVSVRAYEPWSALDGGPDGLDAYRALLEEVPGTLTPNGAVLMECDPSQSKALLELASSALPEGRVEIIEDLAGEERVVELRR